MRIYLAGSVPKGDKEATNYQDWRKAYIQVLTNLIDKVEFFDPNIFIKLEGDALAVTGADCSCIKKSDLIIINATEKIGAGTAMEFIIAKYFKKPVITILPKNSHHRRQNIQFNGKTVKDWIHPFIQTFSDYIIEDINNIDTTLKYLQKKKPKTITVIDDAIMYAEKLLKEDSSA